MKRAVAPVVFVLACAAAVACALGRPWATVPLLAALAWHVGERVFAHLSLAEDVARLKGKVAMLSTPQALEKLRQLGVKLPSFENEKRAG